MYRARRSNGQAVTKPIAAMFTGLSCVALAACGSTSSPTAATKASGPRASVNATIRRYLTEVMSDDPAQIQRSASATVPDSVASKYTRYSLQYAEAVHENHRDTPTQPMPAPATVTRGDHAWRICEHQGRQHYCENATDVHTRNGRLTSFSLGGKPLAGRVRQLPGSPLKLGSLGTIQPLTEYTTTPSGTVVVTVLARNASRTAWRSLYAELPEADRGQGEVLTVIGTLHLPPGKTAYYALESSSRTHGGTIRVQATPQHTFKDFGSARFSIH